MLEMKTNKGGQNVKNENKNKVDRMLEMKTKTNKGGQNVRNENKNKQRWTEC